VSVCLLHPVACCLEQESELKSSLPLLLSNVVDPSPAETQTSIIIEQEDGTEKHIVLATSQTAMVDSASSGEYLEMCGVEVVFDKAACVELRERLGLWLYYNIIGYDDMVTCYEMMTMSRLRNLWILFLKVIQPRDRATLKEVVEGV